MKTTYYYIISIFGVLLAFSCSSWKNTLIENGNHNDAIHNAIKDFINTSKLYKTDSIFYVRFVEFNDKILGVSIVGDSENKLYPTNENKIGTNLPYFPTNYFIVNGKLFYWYDSTKTIDSNLITIFAKYNLIDSMNVDSIVGIPPITIDDSKKGVDYYFCRNNLKKYKKVTTRIAMGWYEYPKLRCNK